MDEEASDVSETDSKTGEKTDETEIITPPQSELEKLYEAAEFCDVSR